MEDKRMSLINLKETINKALQKITEYIEMEEDVCIHFHSENKTIRNSAIIEDFTLDEKGFYLIAGWFQMNIESDLLSIEYIERNNSLCLKFSNEDFVYLEPCYED